jgi:hypothetical protein
LLGVGAAWAAWDVRATAAAAVAESTVTRVRLGCLGRRCDAIEASSFFHQPPANAPTGGTLRRHSS